MHYKVVTLNGKEQKIFNTDKDLLDYLRFLGPYSGKSIIKTLKDDPENLPVTIAMPFETLTRIIYLIKTE